MATGLRTYPCRDASTLPDSGWVSRWIAGPEDAPEVIELFRMQYERYASRAALGSDLS